MYTYINSHKVELNERKYIEIRRKLGAYFHIFNLEKDLAKKRVTKRPEPAVIGRMFCLGSHKGDY